MLPFLTVLKHVTLALATAVKSTMIFHVKTIEIMLTKHWNTCYFNMSTESAKIYKNKYD